MNLFLNTFQDYCDKAPINVEVSSLDNTKKSNFDCFVEDPSVDPCSSKACHADLSSILTPDSEVVENINFKMCVPADNNRLGGIWEINFSTSNDSSKLEGFFVDAARERFRELQSTPEYNTQLSFVSIVGGRGVGKSTVASLLSGNASMFTVRNIIFTYVYIYILHGFTSHVDWKWINWNNNNWC